MDVQENGVISVPKFKGKMRKLFVSFGLERQWTEPEM